MNIERPLISKHCGFCNIEFSTKNSRAIYCSISCANKASKQRVKGKIRAIENKQKLHSELHNISLKEYLSINDSARLLGVSRSTIYRYINSEVIIASRIGKRLVIKKSDIETLFHQNKLEPTTESTKPILNSQIQSNQYYTLKEVLDKYIISDSWFFVISKRYNIKRILLHGNTLYDKKNVDTVLSDKKKRDLKNYMTAKEIADQYKMTLESTYSFTSREKIPSIKVSKTTYYSRKHVHIARGDTSSLETDYYSTEEAMTKYNLSRSSLYNLIRYHNLPKIKKGKFIYIDKIALDHLF